MIVYERVSSTNTLLKEKAEKGAPEGEGIAAKAQSDGRGRMGRSFYSPDGTGLYLSILLRPERPAEEAKFITPMAAVAVSSAIEKLSGEKTEIKWVNDIYMKGKKVSGILTEGSFSDNKISYAVVGIGINLEPPEEGFPDEIKNIAGAVFEKAPENIFSDLADEIYNNLFSLYKDFENKSFIDKYIEKCTFLSEKKVTVTDGNLKYEAIAHRADRECRLEITGENGEKKHLYSGDVSIRTSKET